MFALSPRLMDIRRISGSRVKQLRELRHPVLSTFNRNSMFLPLITLYFDSPRATHHAKSVVSELFLNVSYTDG